MIGQWEPTHALMEGLLIRVDENDDLVLTDEIIKREGNDILCDEISFEGKEVRAKQDGVTLFTLELPAEAGECETRLLGLDLRMKFNVVY